MEHYEFSRSIRGALVNIYTYTYIYYTYAYIRRLSLEIDFSLVSKALPLLTAPKFVSEYADQIDILLLIGSDLTTLAFEISGEYL